VHPHLALRAQQSRIAASEHVCPSEYSSYGRWLLLLCRARQELVVVCSQVVVLASC
jgi:hypothetical protein